MSKWATPMPLIHPRREVNIYYLKITQEEKTLLFKKPKTYLWEHPRGLFITTEGVLAIRALRRKNRHQKILTKSEAQNGKLRNTQV